MSDWVMLAGGFALLLAGGELLVRGAVSVASRLGVSPLLIGLTLVGFGTSTPELVTSVQAALAGSPGIALGNVVGSNIANILLILGLAALVSPVPVASAALSRDGILVLVSALMLAAVGYGYRLDRPVGAVFLLCLVAYIVYAYWQERAPAAAAGPATAASGKSAAYEVTHPDVLPDQRPGASAGPSVALALGMAAAGLILVVFGGKLLVDGAISIARVLGISETIIGLTIVAVGTSMPEFVTSVVAAIRRQSDVALGNILGSNIYNIWGIAGATGLMAPTVIPDQIVRFDNLVMLAASLALLIMARTGWRIGRVEGAVLVAGYGAYVASLWPR